MKIAIITDMHIGVRGDSKIFLDHQERFFNEVFFPYIDEHNIKTVLDLGDTFDRRKYINYVTLSRAKKFFFDQLASRNIEYKAIVGNHSVYYTNTNEVNSMDLLLKEYDNFTVYENEPVELTFGSTNVIMVPWITKTNSETCLEAIRKSNAHICMGHFDIVGFEMLKGAICDHGLSKELFGTYEQVYSGHFHHPSEYGNINYLGAPYEMTWSDYQGKRGFRVLDTENRELEWVLNPLAIYHKIDYDDKDMTIEDIANLDMTNIKDAYIKVIVKNRTNPYIYDLFINKLTDAGAADVKSIDDSLDLEDSGVEDILDETKDTKDILHDYVRSIDTKADKVRIKELIDELYIEAQNI
jgi:DNA repair exonuclease SbcCD nuclease subunit|tara:strand:- start:4923 stop:5984 length:1062 start_codon:yes stop_codon:yes gene_type:complete